MNDDDWKPILQYLNRNKIVLHVPLKGSICFENKKV